jgi:16S rRNA (cytosine967-C5)-methyltransferase
LKSTSHGESNRIRIASLLWDEFCSEPKSPQFDRWLAARMKLEKNFGKRDRTWYSDTLFGVMRHALLSTLYIVTGQNKQLDVSLLLSSASQLSSWENIRSAMSKCDTELLIRTALERTSADKGSAMFEIRKALYNEGLEGMMLWHSIPLSFSESIVERSSLSEWNRETLKEFLERQDTRPPLWIRLNHPEKKNEVFNTLKDSGFSIREIDGFFAAESGNSLYGTEPYKNGLIEIQDFASQKISASADAHPGMYIWDTCAGGGGKTLHIASLLEGRGAVYASDIREYKLEETKLRARRASFSNVRTLPWNGESVPEFPKEITSRGGFHRVLVDAPCSSSGTWRRNPDGKYRAGEKAVKELSALQLLILSNASSAVKIGGLLIYATCSFLPAENESIVQSFISSHSTFSIVSQTLNGNPAADSDTTFTAVIRRDS